MSSRPVSQHPGQMKGSGKKPASPSSTTPSHHPSRRSVRLQLVLFCLLTAVVSALPFVGAAGNQFVLLDDQVNFTSNTEFQGLSWKNLEWAFTTTLLAVYQPLSWILLEAEYVLFGLKPGGFHVASILLHTLCSVATFLCVWLLVARVFPRIAKDRPLAIELACFCVVSLYAVHPLRVETVDWASAQPYLPCALFFVLSIAAYLLAHPEGRTIHRGWLGWSVAFCVLALLSKAPALALPAVLVCIDVYVLRRLGGDRGWTGHEALGVWFEKVPFITAAVVFGVVATTIQNRPNFEEREVSTVVRAVKLLIAPGYYILKTLLPTKLSPVHVHPSIEELLTIAYLLPAALTLLGCITAYLLRRCAPYVTGAWIAYVLLLLPATNLVRKTHLLVGDRYSYIPMLAFVALGSAALTVFLASGPSSKKRMLFSVILCACIGTPLVYLTIEQTKTWRDTECFGLRLFFSTAAGRRPSCTTISPRCIPIAARSSEPCPITSPQSRSTQATPKAGRVLRRLISTMETSQVPSWNIKGPLRPIPRTRDIDWNSPGFSDPKPDSSKPRNC